MSKLLNTEFGHSPLEQNKSVDALEKRIAVLERKADREKKARHLAEERLEQYSLEIYQTNISLENALAYANKKQSELEYLAKASAGVSSEISLSDLVSRIVELTCEYCEADYGFYIVTENGDPVDGKQNDAWEIAKGWHSHPELHKLVISNLPLNETNILETWFVSDVRDNENKVSNQFSWILYMNFALSGGKIGWLAFVSQKQLVDEDIFPVLATARGHLTSGIRRRLTDVRILKRNVQLQDTVNKLENAKRQLIQSERMASLGQLAAGVAHEINNPVAFIRSNMEVLKEYLQDYENLHKELRIRLESDASMDVSTFTSLIKKVDLEYIEKDSIDLLVSNIEGLNRVKDIVENLKSFSHASDVKLVKIALHECVNQALKITENIFKYEHSVNNQLTPLCPSILGNMGQLQQVFVNLFVNAAYAMENGGELHLSYTESNSRVIIHVKDTGVGMDKETVNKLFTPFFTTKPVGVGTGLGLSVSYAILEAHEALVTVDSSVGVGTTFSLSFPILNA